jgi:hypothetical protein
MSTVKYLASNSPRFTVRTETFQAKPGFNEMSDKFTKDPYYQMCKKDGSVKDFVSTAPTDKQHEEFNKKIQAERERADALQKELDELKAAQESGEPKDKKSKDNK